MLLHFILSLFSFPLTMSMGTFQGSTTNNVAKPDCPTHCGNITVPYPFGIGEGCSLDTNSFNLTCNTSNPDAPQLFIGDSNLQIYNISDSEVRVSTIVSSQCYDQSGFVNNRSFIISYLGRYPAFTLSSKNKFTVVGCDDYALISGGEENGFTSGCFGLCRKENNVLGGECLGIGCCQISIPKGLTYYNVRLDTFNYHSNVLSFNECGYGFLVEEGRFKFGGATDLSINRTDFIERIESTMPRVLDWVIASNGTCTSEVINECKGNSSCYDVVVGGRGGHGYRCKCNQGYEGNPYLDQGCQDIDECQDPGTYRCYGICDNTIGSYNCTCPSGSFGNANVPRDCKDVVVKHTKLISAIFIIVVSIMSPLLLVAIIALCKVTMKTKEERQRKWFFTRNGGLLLEQQQKADPSLVDKTILFTSYELKKATDNFSESRILGRGGHGTVYKGMLVDGRIVAVKKSKVVDESQLEQFINEVVILSQINHRNVVKLLGCCLETEVPLVVSEFIPNGTLYDRLHNMTEEFPISLSIRLQIATEVGGALAYLHSSTSIPIYHRDIKTSNILLDDKYRAKVSDFGTSRFISIEQTHLTTIVKGTFGYLDPEYFQSSQFTEKSDVYSFGVVLVELLTREKPISLTRFGQNRSLATHFMLAMEEGRVMSIVDAMVVKEGSRDELLALANLAMRCLNLNGNFRPTMKEVSIELETIRASHIPSTVQTNCTPVTYEEELSMLPYGESSSSVLSFNVSIGE